MADNQRPDPVPPPTTLPEFAKKPPSTFVPPRPPVLHPNVGQPTAGANPFARAAPPLDKGVIPKPTAPNFTPPSSLPLVPPEKSKSSSPVPQAEPPIAPKIESIPSKEKPIEPKSEVSLTPSPPTVTPLTSPAVLPTEPPQTVDTVKPMNVTEERKLPEGHIDMSGGLMSWLTKTVAESKLLNDVAEKAKQGMEQVLTTLDPGMRGFLSDDGTVELYIVAGEASIVRAVKEGFERVFASVLIRPVPAANGNLPPLVNGSAYALEICRERASRVFASKQIPTTVPLLVMQPFLMQIENRTYGGTRLLLEWKGHLLDSISQLLPVDEKILSLLETRSKADGKQAQDFSISLSQAAKEIYSLDCESWTGPPPPFSFSELLEHGSAALALQFMNLTMEQSPASTPEEKK